MSRKVRVATVSFLSHAHPQKNVDAAIQWIDEAGECGADLILFPENFIYHRAQTPLDQCSEALPGPLTGQLVERAAHWNMVSILPTTELDGGNLYNTAAVFDRSGDLAGKYRKTHITLPEIEQGILPGMELPVFDLELRGFPAKIAILICFDFWFPEICLTYALRGAEIICLADMKVGPSLYDIMLRLQGMAATTQTYIVQSQFSQEAPYAPYAGRHQTGRACIAGPEGIILADTGHKPGVAMATIDLDEPRVVKDAGYYGDHVNFKEALRNYRRPELYADLAQPRDPQERVDGATKTAIDKVLSAHNLPPYPGTPFWPEQTPDDPEIFPSPNGNSARQDNRAP